MTQTRLVAYPFGCFKSWVLVIFICFCRKASCGEFRYLDFEFKYLLHKREILYIRFKIFSHQFYQIPRGFAQCSITPYDNTGGAVKIFIVELNSL